MSPLLIVLLVFFTVIMAVWLLALLGAIPNAAGVSPWLAFFACLILGIVVFLLGTGRFTEAPSIRTSLPLPTLVPTRLARSQAILRPFLRLP